MKIADLVNPHIRALAPYEPGKPIDELERELGIAGSIKLASNESAARAVAARDRGDARRGAETLNRYPEDSCFTTCARSSRSSSAWLRDQLIFGAGSDEVLDLLGRCFLAPGRRDRVPLAELRHVPDRRGQRGREAVQVPLDAELRADVTRADRAPSVRARACCSSPIPTIPTGTSLGAVAFARAARGAARARRDRGRRGLRRVRAPAPTSPTVSAWLRERPTLVVLRTFSKIYGLAGLRVGYGVGIPS